MRKKIFVIPLTLLLIVSLSIPVWGAPLSITKYYSQKITNPVFADTAPYPDGAFVEFFYPDNNRIVLYNFATCESYKVSACDVNGFPFSPYSPFIWGYNSANNFEIKSTKPIYRCTGYYTNKSMGDWTLMSTSEPSVQHSQSWKINSQGQFVQIDSNTNFSNFITTLSSSSSVEIHSTTPMCYASGSAYPTYHPNSNIIICPFFDSSTAVDVELMEQLTDIWDEIQLVHIDLTNIISKLNDPSYPNVSIGTRLREVYEQTRGIYNALTGTIYNRLNSIQQYEEWLLQELRNYYSYFSNDYINFLDNGFYEVETRLDNIISELEKLTTNSGESGGKVIDDGVSNAKQKAEDETPDPSEDIDETQFSLQSLLGGFNWVKTQIENFFNITHVDEFIEIVLFIALAGWVIGKKLNKG